MKFFIGAFTTVLGILVGGGMTWFSTVRHDRLVRALERHRELHGTELVARLEEVVRSANAWDILAEDSPSRSTSSQTGDAGRSLSS
ncbi:hypothetical protein AB0C90_24515 [Streptomyces sp. NPDC048550]|uniref:hypothetical protein n=1 Tax=unclassified Streptomyces TaxID=2593676 RepID=UPI003420776A